MKILKRGVEYKILIEKIQEAHLKSIMTLSEFRKKESIEKLPTKSRGLYWLWCKTNFTEQKIDINPKGSAHVPLTELINTRTGLNHICRVSQDEYVIVYNGMGGYKKWTKRSSYGLRARINQECVSNNTKTGTLNIVPRGLNIEDWNVSFFNFDDESNHDILRHLDPSLNISNLYESKANLLETLWRLHYGIPLFCRY